MADTRELADRLEPVVRRTMLAGVLTAGPWSIAHAVAASPELQAYIDEHREP